MAATTSPPRAIAGSPGSRIRVILGKTGRDYFLKLDEDDGNTKWQTSTWNNIPAPLAKQIDNCTAKGRYVTNVDFCSRTNAWYVHGIKRDGSGEHAWWGGTISPEMIRNSTKSADKAQVLLGSDFNGKGQCVIIEGNNGYCTAGNCDPNLLSRIKRINNGRKSIHFVRLFQNRAYFISDDEGTEWSGLNNIHLAKELKKPEMENDVAVSGDGSWIVIRPDSYVVSTGVNKALTNELDRFYREQKQRMVIRSAAIHRYHEHVRELAQERERLEREAREARERDERERQEREEREAQEAREWDERERQEREEREAREARERVERERRELAVIQSRSDRDRLNSQSRQELFGWCEMASSASLVRTSEEHIKEEVIFIEQQTELLEQQTKLIQQQKQTLRKRHLDLKASIDNLPPAQRARIGFTELVLEADTTEKTDCVICHSAAAIRAVIPCGHQCLCDGCAYSVCTLGESSRLCPLCRTPIRSTLKIFSAR